MSLGSSPGNDGSARAAVRRAFLGMGSNLGDRRHTLRTAVAAIADVAAVSPMYETEPVGGPEQGVFLNIVVELETRSTARQLLALCQELEAEAGRVRTIRWGPRTLDVDVLWIDGETVDDDDLVVPHPRMGERNFVMAPLLDLDPTLIIEEYDPSTAVGTVKRVGPL